MLMQSFKHLLAIFAFAISKSANLAEWKKIFIY